MLISNLGQLCGLGTSISLTINEPNDQIIDQHNFANQTIIYLVTREYSNLENTLVNLVG